MHKRFSSLRFVDLAGELCFTTVIWNDEVVFDEEWGSNAYDKFMESYATKIVYKMKITVHSGHHVELKVEGDE